MSTAEQTTVAVVQSSFTSSVDTNVERMTDFVRAAAARGANIVLLPELFEGPYFCREERDTLFASARPFADHPTVGHFQSVAADDAGRLEAGTVRVALGDMPAGAVRTIEFKAIIL